MKRKCLLITFLLLFQLKVFSQSAQQKFQEINKIKNPYSKLKSFADESTSCKLEDILIFANPGLKLVEDFIKSNEKVKKYSLDSLLNIKATCLNSIGFYYSTFGNPKSALANFYKSLVIADKLKDTVRIASALSNIALVHNNVGDFDKAIEMTKKVLRYRLKLKDQNNLSRTYNNLGMLYHQKFNLDSSLYWHQKGLELKIKSGDSIGIEHSLSNIGATYFDLHKNQLALDYHLKSYAIAQKLGDDEFVSLQQSNIAIVLLEMQKFDEAKKFGLLSYATALKFGFPEQIKPAAQVLHAVYLREKKYKEALEMYTIYVQMKDSIANDENKRKLVETEFSYQYGKKAIADSVEHAQEKRVNKALLEASNARLKEEQTQRFAMLIILIIVSLSGLFIFNRFRITRKQKKIIEEQKEIVEAQKEIVEEKQKEVMDSIKYARRIQSALLPSDKSINKSLSKLNRK